MYLKSLLTFIDTREGLTGLALNPHSIAPHIKQIKGMGGHWERCQSWDRFMGDRWATPLMGLDLVGSNIFFCIIFCLSSMPTPDLVSQIARKPLSSGHLCLVSPYSIGHRVHIVFSRKIVIRTTSQLLPKIYQRYFLNSKSVFHN